MSNTGNQKTADNNMRDRKNYQSPDNLNSKQHRRKQETTLMNDLVQTDMAHQPKDLD